MTAPIPPQDSGVATLLDRHAVRRAGGIPTVSVLVGPVGAAIAAFRSWAATRGQPVEVGAVADPAGVAALFVGCASRSRDLVADAHAYLAAHLGRSAAELRATLAGMTRHDLDRFFAANDVRLPPGDGTRLARSLCEAALTGGAAPAGQLLAGGDPLEAVCGLAALIPAGQEPAVLLSTAEWFGPVAAAAVAVATRVPRFPLAIVTTRAAWQEYESGAPETRVKALIREGVVELPVAAREQVERALLTSGVERVPPLVREAAAGGAPTSFTTALAAAAAAPGGATSAEADDAARSAAERFLFEFLELLPATAGRFELNADPGFRFGPRAAEVDLLARDLRIAVEIDGYYHFRDADNYRRDREKDWELQRHGFLVLRFLADDILPRLEDVRDRIISAVTLRTAGSIA